MLTLCFGGHSFCTNPEPPWRQAWTETGQKQSNELNLYLGEATIDGKDDG